MENEKQFYVLISINNLEYLKDDGYTSDEIDEAVKFDKPKQALKYLKEEIDNDCYEEFEIFEIKTKTWIQKVDKKEVKTDD